MPAPNAIVNDSYEPHAVRHAEFERQLYFVNVCVCTPTLHFLDGFSFELIEDFAVVADKPLLGLVGVVVDAFLVVPLEAALTEDHFSLLFAQTDTVGS